MPTTESTLVAVFRNSSDAQAAVNELKANGVSDSDIYISNYSESGNVRAAAAQTGAGGAQTTSHHEGGIVGWFKSLFGEGDNHPDRTYYEGAVSGGNVLVSVNVDDDDIEQVLQILQKHNPEDVDRDTASSATASGLTAGAATSSVQTSSGSGKTSARDADLPKSIPVIQEDVRVGKRAVLRGGVRVYSQVVEEPVEETIRLKEEHIRVDRQPVNRRAEPGDLQQGRDQVIEVQEYAEEPVVAKEARVVEEVRISKDASERTETVRDNVRHTEVNVENIGQGQGQTASTGAYDDDFRSDFQTRYASTGGNYEDYGPAYQYGYQAASDPRYQGRSWDDVQSDLQRDYGQRYPSSTWERMKDSIRYGWDKVTGRAKSAGSSR